LDLKYGAIFGIAAAEEINFSKDDHLETMSKYRDAAADDWNVFQACWRQKTFLSCFKKSDENEAATKETNDQRGAQLNSIIKKSHSLDSKTWKNSGFSESNHNSNVKLDKFK